ncbi:MAG TPA: hypothetical protein VGB18_04995, partial [Candidatus Thermoplasmatota archaeon]
GALVFPGGRFEGGFFCPSDAQGQPTGDCPELPGASYGNGVFIIPDVPRSLFGLDRPSAVMERPWIESGNHVLATVWLRADRSEEGRGFTFQRGAVAPSLAPSEPTTEKSMLLPSTVAQEERGRAPAAESPMPSTWLAVAALSLVALFRPRRGNRRLVVNG